MGYLIKKSNIIFNPQAVPIITKGGYATSLLGTAASDRESILGKLGVGIGTGVGTTSGLLTGAFAGQAFENYANENLGLDKKLLKLQKLLEESSKATKDKAPIVSLSKKLLAALSGKLAPRAHGLANLGLLAAGTLGGGLTAHKLLDK